MNIGATAIGAKSAASFDGAWCGTKPPGPPIPRPLQAALGSSRLEQLALNPQPLPPRQETGVLHQQGRVALDDDWCGTVPRRFPPLPPSPLGEQIAKAMARD